MANNKPGVDNSDSYTSQSTAEHYASIIPVFLENKSFKPEHRTAEGFVAWFNSWATPYGAAFQNDTIARVVNGNTIEFSVHDLENGDKATFQTEFPT